MPNTLLYAVRGSNTLVSGSTAREVVANLRAGSTHPVPGSLEDWMEDAASAARQQTGERVETDTPELFLQGLENAGLLARILLQ